MYLYNGQKVHLIQIFKNYYPLPLSERLPYCTCASPGSIAGQNSPHAQAQGVHPRPGPPHTPRRALVVYRRPAQPSGPRGCPGHSSGRERGEEAPSPPPEARPRRCPEALRPGRGPAPRSSPPHWEKRFYASPPSARNKWLPPGPSPAPTTQPLASRYHQRYPRQRPGLQPTSPPQPPPFSRPRPPAHLAQARRCAARPAAWRRR